MPRRPRIKLAGIPQHLVQRGVNRGPCFFAEEDYHCYLHWLKQAAVEWQCAIHAYVLMTNHVHLLITPQTPEGLAKFMQSVGRRYVQYINRTYQRSGTLWEGRYKSRVIQAETYLLTCMRYIELNPVRANMVQDPGQYRWSSYRHNVLAQADKLLTPHALYLSLGQDTPSRQDAYRQLLRSQLDNEALSDIRLALTQSQPLGNTSFAEAICEAAGVRKTQKRRGRPVSQQGEISSSESQVGFGF
jgi:putative transposase